MLAIALLAAAPAAAERLSQAAPCFPGSGRQREVDTKMTAARQAHAEAFAVGVTTAAHQRRYVERSDPVVCNEVRLAPMHHLRMPN